MSSLRTVILAFALPVFVCASQAQVPVRGGPAGILECGSLDNGFGPFDYRPDHYRAAPLDHVPHKDKLQIAEIHHFSPLVASLVRGQTAAGAGGDLDYMLRAFPNHHPSLAALLKIARGQTTENRIGLPRPAECYFDRALRFAANDSVARLLYAQYLIIKNRIDEANRQIDVAVFYAGDNVFTHYNCGLVYFEAKNYSAALRQAHFSRDRGFEVGPLRQSLIDAGQWSDASAAPSTSGAASSP